MYNSNSVVFVSRRARFGIWLIVVAVFCCTSIRADVIDIDLTGNQAGPVEASRNFFVPGNDPEAHFFTPTGAFDEQVFPQANPTPGGIAWWDVEFKVTRTPDQDGDEMITIDKIITNNTGVDWLDFHATLGRGVGPNFEESGPLDRFYFKTDPAPQDELGFFELDPDMPFDRDEFPDNVWFLGNLGPDKTTAIWFGLNVPHDLFDPETNMATFTIRQHATPEPSGGLLLVSGVMGLVLVRRRARLLK